jgi:hypothetical protein
LRGSMGSGFFSLFFLFPSPLISGCPRAGIWGQNGFLQLLLLSHVWLAQTGLACLSVSLVIPSLGDGQCERLVCLPEKESQRDYVGSALEPERQSQDHTARGPFSEGARWLSSHQLCESSLSGSCSVDDSAEIHGKFRWFILHFHSLEEPELDRWAPYPDRRRKRGKGTDISGTM